MAGISPPPQNIQRPSSSVPPSASPNITTSSNSSVTPNPTAPNPNGNVNINSNATTSTTTTTNNTSNNTTPVIPPRMPIFSNGRPELPPPRWYDASVPLGVNEDKYYLSELQCVLRSEFVEAFGTTQTDTVLPVHGRNRPIALGQVGIRCQHCKDISYIPTYSNPNNDRNRSTQNAISYPSFISGIYNTVQQMYRLHFDQCPYIPDELKGRVGNLKDSHTSNRGGRKQYWIESAKRIGLVDTSFGIHYGRDPEEPLPPLGGVQRSSTTSSVTGGGEDDEYNEWGGLVNRQGSNGSNSDGGGEGRAGSPSGSPSCGMMEEIEIYPLVLPEDKPLISDYLYLALEQMQPCNLMDADRVGCYKGRRTGFPGLACKHCIGQAGCGRYFPASEASLSQTTTSQTIVNHVRNCRRCPLEIREQLELMKRAKTCSDYKKSDKPKHGGRKVFFHRLWCRIQRIPLPKSEKSSSASASGGPEKESPPSPINTKENTTTPTSPERKKRKKSADSAENENRKSAKRSLSMSEKKKVDDAHDDSDSDMGDGGEGGVVEMVEFDNVHNIIQEGLSPSSPTRATAATATENSHIIYQGRTRLTKGDDPHWLSEADCYIRQELAEVFTAQEEDLDLFGDPEIGQVGIRCFYCAESKAPEDRSRGHIYYPSSVGSVQQAVSDLQRRHLGLCSEIPEHIRESFRSMKGYGAKPKGDTTQYWMDAAKELGLHDSHEGQGISFFRNPLDNSPADEIDTEKNEDAPTGSILVPAEDRQKCTNQMLLLMKQFEPCQFRTSDRKSSRSRDRAMGFPGLVCVHCNQKRYFPITEKKLQDSLGLMTTHINNCFHARLDVKASLCYLQHRSLLQKQELPGQWKYTFFKGVWNRLHQNHSTDSVAAAAAATDADASTTTDAPVKELDSSKEEINALPEVVPPVEDRGSTEEEEIDATENPDTEDPFMHDNDQVEEQDNTDALKDMKELIKSAALWLSERDAEDEARARGGRGRGIKRR